MGTLELLAGSYNMAPWGSGNGLDLLRLDLSTGTLQCLERVGSIQNPSFLAKNGDCIYAVQELLDQGSIVSFRYAEGRLKKIGVLDSPGGLMCHLNVWPGGKFVSAANYWTGSMTVFPIGENGVPGDGFTVYQYQGTGTDPVRQEGPHTHSTCIDPSGKWLLVAELGIDRIFVYEMNEKTGELIPAQMPFQDAPAGFGPRHFAFSEDGRSLYVTAEMGCSVLHYGFDASTGALTLLQVCAALPPDYTGTNLTADIHLSDDGRFLYASNRGHDSIAVFPVLEGNVLGDAAWYSSLGEEPRHFRLIGENLILIANQKSGNLVCCKRDPETGAIGARCSQVLIPSVVYTLPLENEEVTEYGK